MRCISTALVLVLVFLLVALLGCSSGVPAKANTPADIASKVSVGMASSEVLELVDQGYFDRNKAFIVLNFSKLQVTGGTVTYEATKELDSPYYGYLFFGAVVQDLNPALVGFRASGDTVIAVARIPFTEAQALVEWQSGRPFRR